MVDRNIWLAAVFALCDVVEPLIIAGLIARYFSADFALDRLHNVLGLLLATVAGTVPSSLGAAVASRLVIGPSAAIVTTWGHWWAGVAVGVVTVAPLVIGLCAAMREPPPRSELREGTAALVALAAMTGAIIVLPQRLWDTVVPGALLFPMLLWLAARCRPVFAAAGALMISLTVAWTTIFGIGHFGDTGIPIDYRILQAQAIILVATIGAYVLAALFAERRDSEARLARANMMLERERDNKLVNVQAALASIAHEVKQPLAAIVTNGNAAQRWLKKVPPDHHEVGAALNGIVAEGKRISEVFNSFRALFGKVGEGQQAIDVNEIVVSTLQALHGELKKHGVTTRTQLTPKLPLVEGHRGQLQEVISKLVLNAIEAMDATIARNRLLRVGTECRSDKGMHS
jgi:signal transduction histidine kinase